MSGIHIIFLYADAPNEWNCSEWRAKIPSDAMNAEHEAGRLPHTAQLFYLPTAMDWNHPEVQKQLGLADIIVFQRNIILPEVWAAMDYWRALGKGILVDLDDHYPCLPPSNPAFQYWIRNTAGLDPDPVKALEEGLRHADALTSPSKVILRDWEHVVPGYWVPNWTRRLWYQNVLQKPLNSPDLVIEYAEQDGQRALTARPRPESEGWIILGWGGSISHVDSWVYSGLIGALERLFEKWPMLRLKFCGHEQRLNYVFDKWGGRLIRQDGVQPCDWPQVVSTFDIGLAPLDLRKIEKWGPDSPEASYDERRSWLKGAEYLTAGVPWVGSRSLTYSDLERHGTLVENTPEAWFEALDYKIKWLANEKKKAWELRRWALRHITFEENIPNYIETLNRIMIGKQTRAGAKLPGITWVKGRGRQKPPAAQPEVPEQIQPSPARVPLLPLELRDRAEAANWRTAHEWHVGLGLRHLGVEIGDAMAYDALRIMGRIWIQNAKNPVPSS